MVTVGTHVLSRLSPKCPLSYFSPSPQPWFQYNSSSLLARIMTLPFQISHLLAISSVSLLLKVPQFPSLGLNNDRPTPCHGTTTLPVSPAPAPTSQPCRPRLRPGRTMRNSPHPPRLFTSPRPPHGNDSYPVPFLLRHVHLP